MLIFTASAISCCQMIPILLTKLLSRFCFFFFSEKNLANQREETDTLLIRLPACLSRSWLKSGKSLQCQEKYESPPNVLPLYFHRNKTSDF